MKALYVLAVDYVTMSILHLNQIESGIKKHFDGLIDLSDLDKVKEEDRDTYLLTRGLAAYCLMSMAYIESKPAAQSVVDSMGDNGIDLIYHDSTQGILYLIQSKWNKTGTKGISHADSLKFINGVEDLFNCRWEKFNEKIKSRKDEIKTALEFAGIKVVLAICQTSTQRLPKEAQAAIDQFMEKANDVSEMVSFELFDQARLHKSLLRSVKGDPVDVDVSLSHWGHTESPYFSYYGQIDASVLAEWYQSYGKRLLADNIRYYKGITEVNDAIRLGAEKEPTSFFFLNNGITAVCQKIDKKPIGATSRVCNFSCKGLSIVNGAQTVGSLTSAHNRHPDMVTQAKVFIKIISLEEAPSGFVNRITIAANTQNRIELRDFASLDKEQNRIYSEMFLQGKKYAFRDGDDTPLAHEGCTLSDSAVALACAHPDLAYSVVAKNKVSDLWNVQDELSPYKRIFNEQLTVTRLWRTVEVMRLVDACLISNSKKHSDKSNLTLVHGNRFLLHKVFESIGQVALNDEKVEFESVKRTVSGITSNVSDLLIQAFYENFPTDYPMSLFRNQRKCRLLNDAMETISPIAPNDTVVYNQQLGLFDEMYLSPNIER